MLQQICSEASHSFLEVLIRAKINIGNAVVAVVVVAVVPLLVAFFKVIIPPLLCSMSKRHM